MSARMKKRFLPIGTLILLVPFLVLSYLNYNASREWTLREITTSALPLTRDNIYSEIHADFSQPLYVSSTMANDSFLKQWAIKGEKNIESVRRYLEDIHLKYGYFSTFFVSAQTNKYYHYKGLHKVVSRDDNHDQWYYNFIDSNVEYRLEVDNDEAGKDALTIFINFRVEDRNGKLLGVTGVGMKMDTVADLLEDAQAKYDRRIYLVDQNGLVQAHSDKSKIHAVNIRNEPGLDTISNSILSGHNNPRDHAYESPAGNFYLTSRYIPEFEWFLIVEQAESTALVNARHNLYRTIIFGFAAWVGIVTAILFVAKRQHERLESIARTDALTGLANRLDFEEKFTLACYRNKREEKSFCVILVDLDGFKAVNDQLNHIAGDELLKAVSTAMKKALRPTDIIARWGGDEFIVLAECGLEEAEQLAQRLQETVEETARKAASKSSADPRHDISLSYGLVAYEPGMTMDNMTRQADDYLYVSKEHKRKLKQEKDSPPEATEPYNPFDKS